MEHEATWISACMTDVEIRFFLRSIFSKEILIWTVVSRSMKLSPKGFHTLFYRIYTSFHFRVSHIWKKLLTPKILFPPSLFRSGYNPDVPRRNRNSSGQKIAFGESNLEICNAPRGHNSPPPLRPKWTKQAPARGLRYTRKALVCAAHRWWCCLTFVSSSSSPAPHP
jgi:hypothetical protein